jgi:hypothetical protein
MASHGISGAAASVLKPEGLRHPQMHILWVLRFRPAKKPPFVVPLLVRNKG